MPSKSPSKEKSKPPVEWRFKLYIAGETPRSLVAFANLKRICELHLHGEYAIEVVDLQLHPGLAKADQIVATPSLVRQSPAPIKKIIGDLANEQRLLAGLDIIIRDPRVTEEFP